MTIDGLPTNWLTANGAGQMNLANVPAAPSGPRDPRLPEKREAWERWYSEVLRYREHAATLCAKDARVREDELALCASSPIYFITVWCWVYEERPGQSPLGTQWLPAIPQPFHVELIAWVERRWASAGGSGRQGAISKSRDMGVTWYLALWLLHGFLFRKPFSAKVISRKEELVDVIGDLDSVIERAACHLFADEDGWCPLPAWMRPAGIDDGYKKYRQTGKVSRPGNRNRFRGEATSKRAARGGRSAVGFIDEACHIDILRKLLGSIRESVGCLLLCSSESVENHEVFQDLCKSLKAVNPDYVLELDYWRHFYHDDAWLVMKEREDYPDDHDAFVCEVLRDPYGGHPTWIYEDFRKREVVPGDFPYAHPMPLYVGFDPGFDDDTAAVWCAFDGPSHQYRVVEAASWRFNEPEFYAHILAGKPQLPGQLAPVFDFTQSDYHLMEQTAVWSAPMVCGDPNGTERRTGINDSFYQRMRMRYLELTGNPLDIRVNWKVDKRSFQGRWNSLRQLLRRTEFNDTPGVRFLMEAVRHARLEEPNQVRTTEQKAPRHNVYSHWHSAFEFLAVNVEVVELLATQVTETGTRVDPPTRRDVTKTREAIQPRTAA